MESPTIPLYKPYIKLPKVQKRLQKINLIQKWQCSFLVINILHFRNVFSYQTLPSSSTFNIEHMDSLLHQPFNKLLRDNWFCEIYSRSLILGHLITQVRCKEVRRADHISSQLKGTSIGGEPNRDSSAGICYSVEIKDVYLPPWLISGVCNAMQSNGTDFEARYAKF